MKLTKKNKKLWDNNFIKVDGDDDVQSCDKSGNWVKAEPLNNLKWDQFKKENSDLDEDDLCDKFYKKLFVNI